MGSEMRGKRERMSQRGKEKAASGLERRDDGGMKWR